MTILVQQQLREATERLICEGDNCWPETFQRFTELASPVTILALLDEIDRLNALVIERETVRIGQSLQRHDDQKQIDELVALGIQQDKDEIASLKAKVSSLEEKCQLLALHGELAAADADWASDEGKEAAKERDSLKAENAELKVKAARWQYVRHYGLPDRGRNKDGELVFRYFLWNETPWLPTAEEAIDQAMTKEQQS